MQYIDKGIYNGEYAQKYLKTIKTPYTQLKCETVADAIAARTTRPSSVVIDFGGNIHGTVKNGLRGALERRDDSVRYVPVDLSADYFNADFLKCEDPSVEVYSDSPGIVADARDTQLPAGYAHAVVIADVLEHIEQPEDVLTEAHRILDETGYLVVVSPSLYKLDVFKGKRADIKQKVEERRTSSHVNFFDYDLLKGKMGEAGFAIDQIQGVGFATGFPYLLWHNPDFIPGDNAYKVTADIVSFNKVKRAIDTLTPADHAVIDGVMNNPDNAKPFLTPFVFDSKRHPLEMAYKVLTLHPEFPQADSPVREVYGRVKDVVDKEKGRVDPDGLRNILSELVAENPYKFMANSVLVKAEKVS